MSDRLILERDVRCVRCGATRSLHVHHRMLRAGGRDERACNKIALCAECHDWVHHHPAAATQQGWIVSRYSDPAVIPVDHFGQEHKVYLTSDYGFSWMIEG